MTDFKEFLRSEEANDEGRRGENPNMSRMVGEWSLLKDKVRVLAANESYKGKPFEWSPYSAPYADFVRLGEVAAIFRDSRSLPDTPLACEIFIGRRPLAANELWIEDEAPSFQILHLGLHEQNGQMAWQVKELRKTLSTDELANSILLALVKYFDEYAAFYKAYR